MSTQPLMGGPPLKGITREEAVALSHGLLELLERVPELEGHPLVVGMTRLLISLDHEAPERRLAELEQDLRDDQEVIARLCKENAEFRHLVTQQADEDGEKARLENTIRGLRHELEETRQAHEVALRTLRQNKDAADRSVASLQEQLGETQQTIRELERQVIEVKRKSVDGTAELERLRAFKKGVRETIASLEWSAKHPRFTLRGSRQPVPCCPLCQRINPRDFVGDKDAGHLRGCGMTLLTKFLTD